MAIVLSSEESSYFSSGGLRRSHSQSHFGGASSLQTSSSSTNLADNYGSLSKSYSRSAPSSASSSPRIPHAESTEPSSASTPASNFSLASDFDDDTLDFADSAENGLDLSYKQEGFFLQPEPPTTSPDDNLEPPPSPKSGDSYIPSPDDYASSNETPKPDTPEFPEHAEDDSAVSTRPSRQVDYLSHEWREEDIWSSWRYIVNRRGEFPNSARLENASWRTWMKAKNHLSTVSPETLNWLKDCDVTWLYGPLQPGSKKLGPGKADEGSSNLSRTDSFVNGHKKPILKKRSMSEVMLQRSLSTASLLKQATAAVQAQETKGILLRPNLIRSNTDYASYSFASRRMSHGTSSFGVSTESSGITSPSCERKHIHFNEQVEQCIAVDVKGEDDDDVDTEPLGDDSDDSDDGVMMKRSRSRKSAPILKRKKKSPPREGKTIAMLPSTTLKYREDTPEPQETAMKHSTGRSHLISPSSSQETLRPSTRGRFSLGDDDEDVMDGFCDPDVNWGSPPPEFDGHGGLHRSNSTGSLSDEPAGMRRTPSGMFMPYEEGDANGDGIFGRVIDTVNTARDIAHVIWNVGWRK